MLDAHVHLGTLLRSSSSCLCLKKRPLHIILGHSNSVGLKIFCVVFCFFLLHCFYVISYLLTDTSVGYLLVNFSIFIHRCKTSRKSHLWISLSQSQPNLLSNNPSAFTKTAVEGNMFCFVAPCTCTCRMEGWNFCDPPSKKLFCTCDCWWFVWTSDQVFNRDLSLTVSLQVCTLLISIWLYIVNICDYALLIYSALSSKIQ